MQEGLLQAPAAPVILGRTLLAQVGCEYVTGDRGLLILDLASSCWCQGLHLAGYFVSHELK